MKVSSKNELPKAAGTVDETDEVFDCRLDSLSNSFDRHHVYLQNYVFGLTQNWADAEDLMQVLWRHALLHLPEQYIGQLGILRRKLYQLFVDRYRSVVRRKETITDEVPETQFNSESVEAYSDEEEEILKERFWSDLSGIELTDTQKDAVWLHGRFQYTYQEIAEKIGVPKSTICDWIAVARIKIREKLEA